MELKFILESILFSAQRPMSPKDLREVLATAAEQAEDEGPRAWKKTSAEEITATLEQLARDHEQAQRSYRLACVAGSWQFFSQPEYAPWIKALVGHKSRPPRLSQPALETLAIIAYRQPLTRAEMEQVRGVAVDGVIATLLERGLIEQVGRAEVPGRPMTYGTTPVFLEYFGLRGLEDLPAADELRRVPIAKPDTLLTAEPGLATSPPEQLALQPASEAESEPAPAPGGEPAGQSVPRPAEDGGSEPSAAPAPIPETESNLPVETAAPAEAAVPSEPDPTPEQPEPEPPHEHPGTSQGH